MDFLDAYLNARNRGDEKRLELQRLQMQKDQFAQQLGLQREENSQRQSNYLQQRTDNLDAGTRAENFNALQAMAQGVIQPATHTQLPGNIPIASDQPYDTTDPFGIPQQSHQLSTNPGGFLGIGPTVAPPVEMNYGGNKVTFVSPEHRQQVSNDNVLALLARENDLKLKLGDDEYSRQIQHVKDIKLPPAVERRALARVATGGAIDYASTYQEAGIDALLNHDADTADKFFKLHMDEVKARAANTWTPAMQSTANSNEADALLGGIDIPSDPKKKIELSNAIVAQAKAMQLAGKNKEVIGKLLRFAATLVPGPTSGGINIFTAAGIQDPNAK